MWQNEASGRIDLKTVSELERNLIGAQNSRRQQGLPPKIILNKCVDGQGRVRQVRTGQHGMSLVVAVEDPPDFHSRLGVGVSGTGHGLGRLPAEGEVFITMW